MMSRIRYSLLSVFAGLTFVAVACAALAKPSYLWASAIWTLTLVVLAGAAIGCFYGSRRARAFCFGFALFGGGHMLLAFTAGLDQRTGGLLFTRAIVDRVGPLLGHADVTGSNAIWDLFLMVKQADPALPALVHMCYVIIGQSLMTLLVALAGGLIGRQWAGRG